jgi:hypothetical protein
VLTALLLLATAFVAGVTGAWSPCGFSMVETLGSALPRVGARVVRTSCATFALGALVGGAVTFAALGALGSLFGGGGSTGALVVAAVVALSCAFGEATGARVVPQIRRQVPEPWRRTMPLPLAAGLYGVLLGLGFTTFVLTLAVWALAGISVAIGSPLVGLLIGLGFGAGRALPVVVLAPRYATLGQRLEARMAEQPALLRRLRLADGALLAAVGIVLLSTGSASAAVVADGATDPSFAGGALAWQTPLGRAAIVQGDARSEQPAQNVALGGRYLALRQGDTIAIVDRTTGALVGQRAAPGATQLAVSDRWLVWRATRAGGGDRLYASALPALAQTRLVAGVRARKRIGRPALDGDRLAYAVAEPHESRIVLERLARGSRRVVLRAPLAQLSQPALDGGRLLFVQSTYCSQRLRLARLAHPHRGVRTLLRIGSTAHRDSGHDPELTTQGREPSLCPRGTPPRTDTVLWTTALGGQDAYVTLLDPSATGAPRTTLTRVGA